MRAHSFKKNKKWLNNFQYVRYKLFIRELSKVIFLNHNAAGTEGD